jgi:hypothetical protein
VSSLFTVTFADESLLSSLTRHLYVGTLIAQKKDIETKVNCPIQIQSNSDKVVVSIASTSEDRDERGHSVVRFKRILQDLLIAHLNDDQCRGRLLYDLAKSASGSYRISQTLSGVVKQQSIVEQDGLVWMRLIDVPNEVSRKLQQLNADVEKMRARDPTTPIYIWGFSFVQSLCTGVWV